jgi:hypothetical protein
MYPMRRMHCVNCDTRILSKQSSWRLLVLLRLRLWSVRISIC